MDKLRKEFEYYLANKENFLSQYEGKFIVLKDEKVIGIFDDRLQAIKETSKTHAVGSFLVQHVTEVEEQARFHSRRRAV